MEFSEIITSIIWGASFGYLSIQLLSALVASIICLHGLMFANTIKSKTSGYLIACVVKFSFYLFLLYLGNYLVDDYLYFRRIMYKPVFIIFCVIGSGVSLISVPKRIITFYNISHDILSNAFFELYHKYKK